MLVRFFDQNGNFIEEQLKPFSEVQSPLKPKTEITLTKRWVVVWVGDYLWDAGANRLFQPVVLRPLQV
jgi:hypothetical protein